MAPRLPPRLPSAALALAAAAPARGAEVDAQAIVYGKYYSTTASGGTSALDNSYYLYRPAGHDAARDGKLPIIIQIHGGGFSSGGPTKRVDAAIQSAVDNGIAYVSVGYRLVNKKYYYGNGTVEELIHVDADGRLTLDTSGRTMEEYRIRRTIHEFTTKCYYDAAQVVEHLIAHADELGVDVHRISTTGSSAGGGEIHYLTWVYHRFNVGRYTPVGMVYTMAQLDYPMHTMMDRAWTLWADDVGESTRLSSILNKAGCPVQVGSVWCKSDAPAAAYDLCNATFQAQAMAYCGDAFDTVTIGELRDSLVWPADDPEVGAGMPALWYTSLNMQKHAPRPFHLYVANELNSTAWMSVEHCALYSRNYAKYAEQAGVNYTVYYTDYNGMVPADRGSSRVQQGTTLWNYRSSHDWTHGGGAGVQISGSAEQLRYHCLALGQTCSA